MAKKSFSSKARLYTIAAGEKLRVRCRFDLFEPPHEGEPVVFKFTRREYSKYTTGKGGALVPVTNPSPHLKLVSGDAAQKSASGMTLVAEVSSWKFSDKTQMHSASVDVEISSVGGDLQCQVTWVMRGAGSKKGPAVPVTANTLRSTALNRDNKARLDAGDTFPRLVRAINDVAVAEKPDAQGKNFANPGGDDIDVVRRHVGDRMRKTLDAVWTADDARTKNVVLDFFEGDAQTAMLTNLKQTAREQFTRDDKSLMSDEEIKLWVANELWARAITEVLLLSPYTGPGLLYTSMTQKGVVSDTELFKKSFDEADPAHGLGYACQHLATMGVLARGVDPRTYNAGKNNPAEMLQIAAGSSTVWIMKKAGGKWWAKSDGEFDGASEAPPPAGSSAPPKKTPLAGIELIEALANVDRAAMSKADELVKIADFGPGAVFLWSNGTAKSFEEQGFAQTFKVSHTKVKNKAGETVDQEVRSPQFSKGGDHGEAIEWARLGSGDHAYGADNTRSAHAAFVLRVDRKAKKLQCFDTGGANCRPDRGAGLSMVTGDSGGIEGGLFDDPASDSLNGTDEPYRGVGTLPARTYEQLKAVVLRQRRSRPLGFGRLLLARASMDPTTATPGNANAMAESHAQWLLYASPLIRLYGDEPLENFTRARLAWSLRQLPGREDVLGIWLTYVPQGALARAMFAAPRATKIAALIQQAGGPGVTKSSAAISNSEYLAEHTGHAGTLVGRPDGTTFFAWKRPRTSPISGISVVMKLAHKTIPWDRETGVFSAKVAPFSSEW